jgi:hypothetical protein
MIAPNVRGGKGFPDGGWPQPKTRENAHWH